MQIAQENSVPSMDSQASALSVLSVPPVLRGQWKWKAVLLAVAFLCSFAFTINRSCTVPAVHAALHC